MTRARLQDAATPLWRRLFGGCHLNRDSLSVLRAAGFEVRELDRVALGLPWADPVIAGIAQTRGAAGQRAGGEEAAVAIDDGARVK